MLYKLLYILWLQIKIYLWMWKVAHFTRKAQKVCHDFWKQHYLTIDLTLCSRFVHRGDPCSLYCVLVRSDWYGNATNSTAPTSFASLHRSFTSWPCATAQEKQRECLKVIICLVLHFLRALTYWHVNCWRQSWQGAVTVLLTTWVLLLQK